MVESRFNPIGREDWVSIGAPGGIFSDETVAFEPASLAREANILSASYVLTGLYSVARASTGAQ